MKRGLSLMICLLAVSCAPPRGTIELSLSSGDTEVTAEMRSLSFLVAAQGFVPQVFSGLSVDVDIARLETDVPYNTPFFIDVFGCPNAGTCQPEQTIARGCSDILEMNEEEPPREVNVEMVGVDDSTCPPEF